MQRESVPLQIPQEARSEVLTSHLMRIWCDVIRVDAVQPGDDLFDLGGHSLLVAQIVSRVRQEVGVALTMRQVFDNSRFGDFAALVQRGTPLDDAHQPSVVAA